MWILLTLLSSLSYASSYDDALNKAKEAAMIQTGFTTEFERAKSYADKQLRDMANNLGLGAPLGIALFCAKTYRDKSLSFKIGKNQYITITEYPAIIYKINF